MIVNKLSSATYNQNPGAQAAQTGSSSFSNTMKAKLGVPDNLDAIFEEAAARYQVPSALLKAVGKAESDFNTKAVSHCGARGVMQLMPGTAKSLGVADSFDPYQNIMGGSKYLSQMLKKYDGDVKLALASYNAGSNNVDKYGGIPPFKETQNYVRKIMGYLGDDMASVATPTSTYANQSVPSAGTASSPLAGGSSSVGSSSSLNGGSVYSGDLMGAILKALVGFDDFTENDYLLFLEIIKLGMKSSATASLDATKDTLDRESVLSANRLQYLL